jgi:hypothetical protein
LPNERQLPNGVCAALVVAQADEDMLASDTLHKLNGSYIMPSISALDV